MDLVEHLHGPPVHPQRRRSERYEVQCRARIVIGKRHYAGYILDISQRGAKLRTITPIRNAGNVRSAPAKLAAKRPQVRQRQEDVAAVADRRDGPQLRPPLRYI